MSRWTERQIEAWLSPETRMLEHPDGSLHPVAYSASIWSAYDDLIDHGYTHEWIIEIANGEWHPPNGPFISRFSSAVALIHNRHRERVGEFGAAAHDT